jgi:hypothetical protein
VLTSLPFCSVCILSVIRLYSLRNFGLTADPTWDNQPTEFWAILESAAAYICAYLPAIRAGLVRIFPKPWGSTNNHSTINSQQIRAGYVGKSASSCQLWASRELSFKASTLVAIDEGAQPMGGIKVERSVRVVVTNPDLMKPLPRPRPN